MVALSDDLRDSLVAISEAIADQDDRAAQAMLREILKAPQPSPAAQAAESVLEDAARWQFVESAPSAITLRLHNLRPDQRAQYVDAARKQGAKHD